MPVVKCFKRGTSLMIDCRRMTEESRAGAFALLRIFLSAQRI
jgi:hypothetical protein